MPTRHIRRRTTPKPRPLYQEVITTDPNVNSDPNLVHAYFFLGNSYDNQYKPARKGEADNDALLTKAIENYKLAAERDSGSRR